MAIKALIVEDSQVSQYVIHKFVEDAGGEVVATTESGKEAITLYEQHKPDVVFMDIMISDIDGLEATRKIKEKDPNADIVVCTSMGDEKKLNEAREIGIFSYIFKPATSSQVKKVIEDVKHTKEEGAHKGVRVMLADDSQFMRMLLRKHFESFGAEVVGEAGNGEEAVKRYGELTPDLVIMDIVMPNYDGLTAVKEIKEKHDDAYIVMTTSYANAYTVKDAFKAGAKDFIVKPFTKTDIKNVLDDLKQ